MDGFWGTGKPPRGVAINWAHPLAKGLLGYWPLWDRNGLKIPDLVGYRHGTLAGTSGLPVWRSDGLEFDGQSASARRVEMNNENSRYAPTAWTAEGWVRRLGAGTFGEGPILAYGMSGNLGWSLEIRNDNQRLQVNLKDSLQTVQGTTSFVTGRWYHAAGTVDGAKVRVYVNGVLETEAAQTQVTSGTAVPLKIGGRNDSSNIGLNGVVAQVSFRNIAMTPTAIRALAAAPFDLFASPVWAQSFVSSAARLRALMGVGQ